MTKRLGKQTIAIHSNVSLTAGASIAGKKEGEGPLKRYFDVILDDAQWGEKTWEKTESKMQREAVRAVVEQSQKKMQDVHYVFAGDLLNQCIGTGFGMRETQLPLFGLYGACSTMAEGLSLAAMAIDGGFAQTCIAVTSSHFCTAERQYRTPLEYGGQRTPTAQWTVTGAGAVLLSSDGAGPYITHVTTGKIVDMGIKDPNNMGGAMAPAAIDTLCAHFADTGRSPACYDLIVTGDLGAIGSRIVKELMPDMGYDMSQNYSDCGCMIFDSEEQDTHAGGSGCGCSALTLSGYLLKQLQKREINRLLFVATGALLSPTSTLQGESIPCIAHAVAISNTPEA